MWAIPPMVGTSGSGRVIMRAETYGVSASPRDSCFSTESPSAKLPAREVLPGAILRKYTRVGEEARRAPFGFAPSWRCPNPPGGRFGSRCGSLRSTEDGTGQAARMRGRPLWFTDGVGEENAESPHPPTTTTATPPYKECAKITRFSPTREY